MANWSSASVNLTGTTENIKQANKYIESFIDENYLDARDLAPDDSIDSRAGFGGGQVIDNQSTDREVVLHINGRWCAPHHFFERVATHYSLSGTYTDEESGCDFFHAMEFKDGVKTFDEEEKYFSDLSIKYNSIEHYIEDYQWITENKDWKTDHKDIIQMFKKHKITLKRLKEEWDVK